MTVHLVTFATEDMSRSRGLCAESAQRFGVDYAFRFSVWDLDPIATAHPEIFKASRGCGYWAWKPYLIDRLIGGNGFLFNVLEGDILIYSDAGIEFINNVSHIIERMDQDIFLFGNNWEHAHWCKRDVVEAIYPSDMVLNRIWLSAAPVHERVKYDLDNATWLRFGKQVQASVIFFRVSDYTRKFVKEWLDWCLFEGGRLIDDSPSRLPNHPEFREHRHDQAILTTMAYREGIKLHYWPAIYNLGYPLPRGGFTYEKLACYADDTYPTIFHHHRRRNNEWSDAA